MSDINIIFDMSSITTLEAQLTAKLQQGQFAGGQSVKDQAKTIMAVSREQVPEDTGTLANAGFVEESYIGDTEAIRIGYDGTAVNPKTGQQVSDYMMVVHEDLEAHHPKGKAKFFEDPILQYAPKFESVLAAAIAQAMR